jgi:hypothetical protein
MVKHCVKALATQALHLVRAGYDIAKATLNEGARERLYLFFRLTRTSSWLAAPRLSHQVAHTAMRGDPR